MAFPKGTNPNRPPPGSKIKVEPIRSKQAIGRIKKILADCPRDLAFFTIGINTAFRASDLLAIRATDVRGLKTGDDLELRERKTRKNRRVTLNRNCIDTIAALLADHDYKDQDPLFLGQRGPLTVPTVSRMVKGWCRDVGLQGNYGAHSLRKTWGYHQRITFKTPLPILVEAYGHASQRQTLDYLCVQPEEIKSLYANEL